MLTNKVYLDTNIVADMIDSQRVNHAKALELLKKTVSEEYEIYISEDMLSTLYYISKNKKHTLKFFINIIFIDWQILSFGKEIISNAAKLSLDNGLDMEDALQCLCAKENGCDFLITNDKKFYNCDIKIVTVDKFLDLVS